MEFLTLVVGSLLLPLLLSPLIVPAVTTTQVIPSQEETKIEKEAETTITITEDNGQTTTYTWEEYTQQKKAAEETEKRAAEYEEMRRKEKEERKKRDEVYKKYESKYFVYDYKVYPKLNGKDPDVIGSHLWDDDPYSYSQDVYYRHEPYIDNFGYQHGRILQWIDENIVLYDFSRSLGMVIIDRNIDANPFHRSDVFYQYIGVYDYTTVSGMYNVVPVFKIVYPLDPDKLN